MQGKQKGGDLSHDGSEETGDLRHAEEARHVKARGLQRHELWRSQNGHGIEAAAAKHARRNAFNKFKHWLDAAAARVVAPRDRGSLLCDGVHGRGLVNPVAREHVLEERGERLVLHDAVQLHLLGQGRELLAGHQSVPLLRFEHRERELPVVHLGDLLDDGLGLGLVLGLRGDRRGLGLDERDEVGDLVLPQRLDVRPVAGALGHGIADVGELPLCHAEREV
mmetsp:Transcript_3038/g.10481  ORF Transcript_3038/g.10481 Transcript_3038/m.10481 type:complete len:222 (-) Transcript_3038:215-880(-)